jgi:NACHT domain
MLMDPNLLSIILGVAANVLTSLITQFGHKTGELLIDKEFLKKWELEKTALQPLIQNAPHDVAENLQWHKPLTLEETYAFLHAPEVEAIVRQIYSTKLVGDKRRGGLEPIRKEFLLSFSLYSGFEKEQLIGLTELLFNTLVEACNLALTTAIDKGILSAHEAQSAFRHRVLLDELTTVKKNLALLMARHKLNVQEILIFEEKYCQQVVNRHGYITPPYFDAARKLPIDSLYVSPNFVWGPKKTNEEEKELSILQFFSHVYRAVLLGNPGAGKSTLSVKLCCELATHKSERIFAGRKQITPILVVLRDYGAEKKTHNCSILQFIEAKTNANYQLQTPYGAFEYLLLSGRAVVIFDGLDELLDTSYRQEISSDVESFCNLYPSVPILVTSREVGYEQAPLDEKKFEVFRVASFQDTQIKDYVTKWFSVDLDLTPEQRRNKVETFMKESRNVPDLRSNPLMLALMCNIYRGENYIPKNRPDVYEKCAMMLFERWDKSRGILVTLPFEAHISPAMKYLAYWIYADESLRGGVTEKRLIAKTTEYLCLRRFEDHDEAEKAAREFVDFCKGRAWVFTDTGTTKDGDRLFQFTHQTFLEYFTAAYLVRTHPTPDALMLILQPRIAKREWDVVAQLAFQIQYKNLEGAGDELLLMLIEQVRGSELSEAQNFLSYAIRCLEFIVPRPDVTRDIISVFIDHTLKYGRSLINEEGISKKERDPGKFGEIFRALNNVSFENVDVITNYAYKYIIDYINGDDDKEASLAINIGLSINDEIEKRIFTDCTYRINKLFSRFFWLCYEGVYLNKFSILDLIKWYGIDGIFREQISLFKNRVSLSQLLARRVLDAPQRKWFNYWLKDHLDILNGVGSILIQNPTPWITIPSLDLDIFSSFWINLDHDLRTTSVRAIHLSPLSYFSAFLLIAVLLEASEFVDDEENQSEQLTLIEKIRIIKSSRCHFFDFIRLIFCARFEQVPKGKIQEEIDKCHFSSEQQEFIWQWVSGEINLVDNQLSNKNIQLIKH